MLRELVERLAEAVAELERVPRVESRAFPFFVLAAVALASFSPHYYPCIAIALLGLALAARSRSLRAWGSLTGLAALFSAVVSAPALLGFLESRTDVALFVARAVSAASIAAGGIAACGWWAFARAVGVLMPERLRKALELMPVLIRGMGREAVAAAAAREARALGRDRLALAAVIGDVLVRGIERGRALRMAYEARSP